LLFILPQENWCRFQAIYASCLSAIGAYCKKTHLGSVLICRNRFFDILYVVMLSGFEIVETIRGALSSLGFMTLANKKMNKKIGVLEFLFKRLKGWIHNLQYQYARRNWTSADYEAELSERIRIANPDLYNNLVNKSNV
jgi:hypothetical protein